MLYTNAHTLNRRDATQSDRNFIHRKTRDGESKFSSMFKSESNLRCPTNTAWNSKIKGRLQAISKINHKSNFYTKSNCFVYYYLERILSKLIIIVHRAY